MLKLFISYSHADESKVEDFCKYISPVSGKDKFLDIWYDRNITSGDDFWDEIDSHLADRDIVCLFLSKDYLSSESCKEEMKRAVEMHKNQGTLVITVILSKCLWREANENIAKFLSATKDAKEIDNYNNINDAWNEVFNNVKAAANKYLKVKELRITTEFQEFLNDATLLSKAHFNKNQITPDDIFVYQDLMVVEPKENQKKDNVQNVLKYFQIGFKVVFIGDDQSGKTSLLKKAFITLKSKNMLPIYIKDPESLLQGNIYNRLNIAFKEEYETDDSLEEYDRKRIVPLIDDFHKARRPQKIIKGLCPSFQSFILTVDEIFSFDIFQEQMIVDFSKYKICELKSSLRNELIKNWLMIRDGESSPRFCNEELEQIDKMTSVVEQALGKAFGKGIMPAHPFFILYVLSSYEFNDTTSSGSSAITSQGHCYQALITLFLKNNGIAGDLIDGYLNFFTEFAHAIYVNNGFALSNDLYEKFLTYYQNNFNYVEEDKIFLKKVYATNIIVRSSLGEYEFSYPYLYYFFAGKYFSEQWNDPESPNYEQVQHEIDTIIDNLHKNSNAYIAIFISHHTKNKSILDKLEKIAECIYSKFKPATMNLLNLEVFNHQSDRIVIPVISEKVNVKRNRQKELEIKDKFENVNETIQNERNTEDSEDEIAKELRRAMKTVEVIGTIIKNRAGSLSIPQLKEMFHCGMDVHLRFLSSFLYLIKEIVENTNQPNYSDFLIEKLKDSFPDNMPYSKKQEIANKLFWRLNFEFIISLIQTITKSLGSKKLSKIINDVYDEENTPATFIIKQNVSMWCCKTLRMKELTEMNKVLNSPVAQMVMKWLIVRYCNMHYISYKDISRLQNLGISKVTLLPRRDVNN